MKKQGKIFMSSEDIWHVIGLDFLPPGKRDNSSKPQDVQMTFKCACCSKRCSSVITVSHFSIFTSSLSNGLGTLASLVDTSGKGVCLGGGETLI